ncbi:MAG: hypothetical protein A2117_00805 [Candidatus Wildermuthbacteria bacterium GWA2_46_15]|uniref:Peptidase M16 n=1 Tax=Candidatus Wildermuthbacteria bacterium GWA2_46_15 TaxID=1802443 RepID=A0A1G2QP85_9BACT|nr:MAG: hypothetical protein A2117_00805 [Candidatus Wildermuthbacteria bacterium GWA2_46_15]
MASTRALTVLFLVRTGSKYETKKLNGISHLLEHMLFRGTKKWPDSTTLSKKLDGVGGFYNAFTDKEMLGIIIKVGAENLSLAVEAVGEMVRQPLLGLADLAKEKKTIIEEINMREDNPQVAVLDFWEELLYREQPAGWPIIGEKEIVMAISRQDLFRHLRNFFVGENSLMAIAGNFKEKEARAIIGKNLAGLVRDQEKPKPGVEEKQSHPSFASRFKETDQTHLCLGVRGFDAFSPQRYVLDLIAAILGGMMSSRLFIEVREKRGLAYYLRTFTENYTDTGYLVTHLGVNRQRVSDATRIICREYRELKTKKIGRAELTKAKESIRGHFRLGLETSDQFASFFGLQGILGRKVLTPEEEWREIAKITQDDILRVAKEVFRSDRLNLALIGPRQEEKKILKILKV